MADISKNAVADAVEDQKELANCYCIHSKFDVQTRNERS